MRIVLASNNQGKLAELQILLQGLNVSLIPQSQLNIPSCEEPAVTFIENAILKARHAAKLSGLPAIADDSGLIVPALNGEPGVCSARYAGVHVDSNKNIEKLLTNMKSFSGKERQAYFYCLLVFLQHENDPTPIIAEGRWFGEIAQTPQGLGGFGYDPIFFVPEKNCSAAQLSQEEKNQLSHRGMALRMLVEALAPIVREMGED